MMSTVKVKIISIIMLLIVLLVGIIGCITWKIARSRSFQFFGGIVNRVNTEEKVAALTFDDGTTKKVENLLLILESENVKASFSPLLSKAK